MFQRKQASFRDSKFGYALDIQSYLVRIDVWTPKLTSPEEKAFKGSFHTYSPGIWRILDV